RRASLLRKRRCTRYEVRMNVGLEDRDDPEVLGTRPSDVLVDIPAWIDDGDLARITVPDGIGDLGQFRSEESLDDHGETSRCRCWRIDRVPSKVCVIGRPE